MQERDNRRRQLRGAWAPYSQLPPLPEHSIAAVMRLHGISPLCLSQPGQCGLRQGLHVDSLCCSFRSLDLYCASSGAHFAIARESFETLFEPSLCVVPCFAIKLEQLLLGSGRPQNPCCNL